MALDHKNLQNDLEAGLGPPNSGDIEAALREARAMTTWGGNWDGEESMGYSEATLERASKFLTRCAREVWQRHGRAMPVPDIGPGPGGSIDFHWKTSERELLLNLPANEDGMVDFYGDTSESEAIKGKVYASTVGPSPSHSERYLVWLLRAR